MRNYPTIRRANILERGSTLKRSLLKLIVLTFSCMLTLSGKQDESVIRIRSSEIPSALSAHLERSNGLEIHLRNGDVVKWNDVSVGDGFLSPTESSSEKIANDSIALIRIKHVSGFRTRRILGGVLGFAAGSLIGSTLAIGISDTRGKDRLAVGVLFACPIAGAWFGQRLARGRVVWTTILVAPVKGP
jgi:hypothetical protein